MEPTLVKGIRFTPGPNEKRRDLLAKIMDRALTKLGRDAPADKVLSHIEVEADPAIQEVDDDQTIWWRDNKGREQKTTFKTFQNRLSARRKLFHK